jgi:hypothetical protein
VAPIRDQSANDRPHLIIGIDAEGDFEDIGREAGMVASASLLKGGYVDVMRVEHTGSGVSHHLLKNVKSFYERT